jgi:serine/threonine protein kinase/Flp pilus assembly protein TadD
MPSPDHLIESLLAAAVELDSEAARREFVERACRGDADLQRRLEELIANHFRAGSFLETPAPGPVATGAEPPVSERPGTRIRPYQLLQSIGEGGMGIVFLAEQQQPLRRRVALKVLKPGMDTRQVIARFEAERQALALMDHPHIARVLDAGETDSGRPYFVMELVRGAPVTDYCDQNRLTPRERLELFVSVCQAVQHAHHKGIIHRDLKPSNVLVTQHDGAPVVKVIDFGIAKATGRQLTGTPLFTGFAQMIGTPLYMSPEQAGLSGLDVDTRSDLHALGVVLYELLTGTTPFDRERLKEVSFDELRRIIREEEPPRPSARISTLGQAAPTVSANRQSDPKKLSRLMHGELDWIVMKCLEKDRNRRYETANALAQDVQRYLHNEPVQACPPSALYRFRKFARRNRVGLAFSGLFLFFLVALGGGIGWVARDRAARQEMEEREADAALRQAGGLLEQGKWSEAAAWARRAEVVLAGGVVRPALHRRLADVRADLDVVARLGEIRIRRSDVRDEQFDAVRAEAEFARAFRGYGLDVEARGALDAAQAIRSRHVRRELVLALDDWVDVRRRVKPGDPSWRHLLAVARAADTNDLRNQVRSALWQRPVDVPALERLAAPDRLGALPAPTLVLLGRAFQQAGALAKAVAALRQAQQRYPNDLWINHDLGYCLMLLRPPRWREALPYYTAALALRPESPGIRINLGGVLNMKGDHAGAIAACDTAIRLKPDYAAAYYTRGNAYRSLREYARALADYSRAVQLKPRLAHAWNNRGNAHRHLGQPARALDDYTAAIRVRPKMVEAWYNRGNAHCDLGQYRRALADYARVLDLQPNAPTYHRVAWLLAACPDARLRDPARAVAVAQKAVALAPGQGTCWNTLGLAHYQAGDWKAAVAALKKSMALSKGGDSYDWFLLAMAHGQLGEKDAARKHYDRAVRWMENNQPRNEELRRWRVAAQALLQQESGVKEQRSGNRQQPP